MRSILRRALCALMCLCLLTPTLALTESDVSGLRFDVQFHMDPAAFPEGDQALLGGLADLMNIISLQGTLDQSFMDCFDLRADLLLNGAEETRTPLRLYGTDSHWGIQSSLLGDETLMVNMAALLEFSMKAYFHLNIPMQRVALLVSPYVHTSAFEDLFSAWSNVMLAQEGERTIPREDVQALAGEMADIALDDRAFLYWVKAVALEAGYDEVILEAMELLPEWVESFVGEEGIVISFSGATETWRTGDTTLFTRTVEDSVTAWHATVPTTPNGYAASVFYNGQPDGEHTLQLSITDDYEELLLEAVVKANNIPDLTSELPISAPFSLEVVVSGLLFEDEQRYLFQGDGQDGSFTLSMLNPETAQPQLTISGTLMPNTPVVTPDYASADIIEIGVNLLSINDTTLTQLLGNIASPLFNGMIPLLLQVPASSIQSILDLLTESGVLGMLASGGAEDFGEESWENEEFYDEEFFEDEEFYDEEAWEEYDEEDMDYTEE